MAESNALVVRDGTGLSVVPAQQLVLTRAPEMNGLALATTLLTKFETITVENHSDAAAALKSIRVQRQKVERFHRDQKEPINAVRDIALGLEKEDVGAFKLLETKLGARILSFEAEVERQRRQEQERLQRVAVEAARLEAEARAKALRDAAKSEDDAKVKRALNAQARALKDAPVFVAPVAVESPVAKTSTVTRWSAEITDVEALVVAVAVGILRRRVPASSALVAALAAEPVAPLAALEPERLIEAHPWLNAQATQLREEFTLPGVVAVQKTSLSGR